MRFAAIIVAAGRGERLGAGVPKGLVLLAGRPIVARSVEALLLSGVPGLVVVAHPRGAEGSFRSALGDVSFAHTIAYVQVCAMPGLASAIIAYQKVFDSVANAIKAIVGVAIDVVKALGSTILHLPDTLSTAFTYLKWAAIIGGGVWAFLEIKKRSGK
jgi:2-C-methyl-D-erythritol 4-phosphate cytidylyltransferase